MKAGSGSIIPNHLATNWDQAFQGNDQISQEKQQEIRLKLSQISITPENYYKIGLIHLRIKAKQPVIIMGETGIGKTSLIRLMSNITDTKIEILNIHAGITSEDISNTIHQIEEQIEKEKLDTYMLFLDEINTNTNVSGLFKEILIDRCVNGLPINDKIVIMGACNPYKLKEINQNMTQGLILENEMIGIQSKKSVQMQRLVYTVYPLAESMFNFIWDYDKLKETDEREYIDKILNQANLNHKNIFP